MSAAGWRRRAQSVSFVGRERLAAEIAANGLRLTDYRGAELHVSGADVDYRTEPSAAADADLVLVTVKSGDTPSAGETLASFCKPDAIVVSFQNGIGNERELARGAARTHRARRHGALQRRPALRRRLPPGDAKARSMSRRTRRFDRILPAFESAGLPLDAACRSAARAMGEAAASTSTTRSTRCRACR